MSITKKSIILQNTFYILLIVDLLVNWFALTPLNIVTTLLLMPTLIGFYFFKSKDSKSKFKSPMMISLILGFIGFFIAVTMERGENWVAYSHIFFLLESQLIIYAFMSFVRKVKTEKLGFVPIMLILSMSLIFINLVIQNNSFALELLLLIRVLQCAFISALGFILYKSQPIVLTGAILLGLSNFIAGVSYFYMPIPFEYTLTTVCFYLSKILLVKGYLKLSKQEVTGYVT